tara:strand:- start:504 stop:770 length:267 start_codon:yes stop_codon:yes gene_type:complete
MIITTATIIPPGGDIPSFHGKAPTHPRIRKLGPSFKARVLAEWSDGTDSIALSFYDDELRFREEEFIGKTQQEVDDLFNERDRAYLQS